MAVGTKIDSAWAGPADPNAFGFSFDPPKEKTHKIQHTAEAKQLHSYYQIVRDVRESNGSYRELADLFYTLRRDYPDEWLLPLEILEQFWDTGNAELTEQLLDYLKEMRSRLPELEQLIDNGLAMVSERIKGIQAMS